MLRLRMVKTFTAVVDYEMNTTQSSVGKPFYAIQLTAHEMVDGFPNLANVIVVFVQSNKHLYMLLSNRTASKIYDEDLLQRQCLGDPLSFKRQ